MRVCVCLNTACSEAEQNLCYVFNYVFPVTPFGFEVGRWMKSELFYKITSDAILF